jgi:hypothetical protein
VQGGYGVVFANPGTRFFEAGRVAVQVLSKPVYCHGTECFLGVLAQCRGTSLIGARICHGAGFILRAGARVRMQVLAGFVMGAGCRKNHDKQLTHIVRVSLSFYFIF